MKVLKKLFIGLLSLFILFSLSSGFAPKYNSHADETNTWDLSKRVTTKQFTYKVAVRKLPMDNASYECTLPYINKRVSKKVDDYLIRTRNLHDYHLYFSRVNGQIPPSAHGEIATVTFVRK